MLKPKPLTQILNQANTGGVTATLLFSKDGRLLACAGETDAPMIAAISSGIWASFNNYGKNALTGSQLQHVYIECKGGSAIISLVADVLLCLYAKGSPLNAGVIRLKMKTLSEHLEKPLSQLSIF